VVNRIYAHLVGVQADLEKVVEQGPESGEGRHRREEHDVAELDVELEVVVVGVVLVLCALANVLRSLISLARRAVSSPFAHLFDSRIVGVNLVNVELFVDFCQALRVDVIVVAVLVKISAIAAEPQDVLLLELW
jgi:hypothetical protein